MLDVTEQALEGRRERAATLADGLHVAAEQVRLDTVDAATPPRDAVLQTVNRRSAELLILPLQHHGDDRIDALVADVHDTISDIACDTVFVRPGDAAVDVHTVAVFSASGPYDAFKVSLANRLAVWFDSGIQFVHLADPSASDAYVRSMEAYHARLGHMTAVETRSRIERDADLGQRLVELKADADVVVARVAVEQAAVGEPHDAVVVGLDERVPGALDAAAELVAG